MEFTDSWLLDDTEALNLTCEIVVPVTGQSTSDKYGLGGTVSVAETLQVLSCMEVPETLRVDHKQGVRVKIPRDLIIDDPYGYVEYQRTLNFNGRQFKIMEEIISLQHTLKRVTLEQIEVT